MNTYLGLGIAHGCFYMLFFFCHVRCCRGGSRWSLPFTAVTVLLGTVPDP